MINKIFNSYVEKSDNTEKEMKKDRELIGKKRKLNF